MKNTVLQPGNFQKIQDHFKSEKDYRRIMQALRKTRNGLMHIHEQNPHFKDEILNQMEAINNLIGALIVVDLPHPWLEESENDIELEHNLQLN